MYEGEAALVGRLGKYAAKLRELAAIDANLQPTEELIQSALAQLQEAAAQLRRYAERVQFDPRALEQLEDRLAEVQRLKRKYNGGIDDILRIEGEIQQTLSRLENTILVGMLSGVMGAGLGDVSSLPGGLWEVLIGVWLIAKGFNSSAIASESAKGEFLAGSPRGTR